MHIREFQERMALRAQRANTIPLAGLITELKSYNPVNNTVTVTYYGNGDAQELGPMQYLTPFAGAGYGDQSFPEVGTQIFVFNVSAESKDVYVALGQFFNAIEQPPSSTLVAGEKQMQNKAGALIKWAQDGSVSIGSSTTLDSVNDAIVRVRDLVPLITALNAAVTVFNAHIHTGVSTGAGVSGAPSTTQTTYTNVSGATKARAGS